MKTINIFLTLLLCAVAIGFASCSEEDNPSIPTQKEIEAKIIGKWKTISLNGIPILTNKRGVMTFY